MHVNLHLGLHPKAEVGLASDFLDQSIGFLFFFCNYYCGHSICCKDFFHIASHRRSKELFINGCLERKKKIPVHSGLWFANAVQCHLLFSSFPGEEEISFGCNFLRALGSAYRF